MSVLSIINYNDSAYESLTIENMYFKQLLMSQLNDFFILQCFMMKYDNNNSYVFIDDSIV